MVHIAFWWCIFCLMVHKAPVYHRNVAQGCLRKPPHTHTRTRCQNYYTRRVTDVGCKNKQTFSKCSTSISSDDLLVSDLTRELDKMSQNANNGGSGPPSVTLWVKAEPFTYGALPAAPHPRLSFHVSTDCSILDLITNPMKQCLAIFCCHPSTR